MVRHKELARPATASLPALPGFVLIVVRRWPEPFQLNYLGGRLPLDNFPALNGQKPMNFAMIGLGPIEIVIVAAVLLLLIGVPLMLVLVMVVSAKKSRDAGPNVCPACRGKFAGSAKFCPHCGQALS